MKTLRHTAEGAAPARTRTCLPRLTLVVVALAFAAFAASALAGSYAAKGAFVITDSIPANSQGNVFSNPYYMTARTQCDGGFVSFAQLTAGPFHYKVYTFTTLNGWWAGGVGQPGVTCVDVGLLVQSGSASAMIYTGSFDPTNPFPNFGSSTGGLGGGQAAQIGTEISSRNPPHSFHVVVYETTVNGGANYTLLVEGTGIIQTSSGTPTAADGIQAFRAKSDPKGILVRWRTRSEGNALGFNLYRGAAKKVRLTRSIVRSAGNGRGHTYSYIDRSARKGKRAPYYLEVVQRSGSKIMFGPARFAR